MIEPHLASTPARLDDAIAKEALVIRPLLRRDAGAQGFDLVGMTVGQTAAGGDEVVAILRRER